MTYIRVKSNDVIQVRC